MVLKANDRRTPCHDEFRGPRSDYVRQTNVFVQQFGYGGLFDTEDDEQELAFRIAVDRINADTSVLPRSRLVALVEKVGVDDSFRATKKGKRSCVKYTNVSSVNAVQK
ncbi:uncharacterized protein TNCV_4315901 [Trichonephila clavipes]|nr:uncharacterized protein TNCV_4315901 [Trichonephila clavipes]